MYCLRTTRLHINLKKIWVSSKPRPLLHYLPMRMRARCTQVYDVPKRHYLSYVIIHLICVEVLK